MVVEKKEEIKEIETVEEEMGRLMNQPCDASANGDTECGTMGFMKCSTTTKKCIHK